MKIDPFMQIETFSPPMIAEKAFECFKTELENDVTHFIDVRIPFLYKGR